MSEEFTPHPKIVEFWDKDGERLTELIVVAGGWYIKEYGKIQYNEEWIYSRRGLTEGEFIEHLYLTSKIIGMLEVVDENNFQWLQDKIGEHFEKSLEKLGKKRAKQDDINNSTS